jgi:hypothetical protein
VSTEVSADGYERRIGRYGRELADPLIAATGFAQADAPSTLGAVPAR